MDRIIHGDALSVLTTLDDQSCQTCVTSPPYWGLRDYGCDGQLGLEETPAAYVEQMVAIFREVRRVIRDDGTLWLNLGDSYVGSGKGAYADGVVRLTDRSRRQQGHRGTQAGTFTKSDAPGLKPKDLVGIPWRVALALQADGWYLRQDIIWHKPNPMPESVRDRCTKAHEYLFLLSKSPRYRFDQDAIREPYGKDQREAGMVRARNYGYDGKGSYQDWYAKERKGSDWVNKKKTGDHLTYGQAKKLAGAKPPNLLHPKGRNKRSVWCVSPKPYKGAHFATFPPDLIRPCILAGVPVGETVLDPFLGSGTTAAVAKALGRRYLGIELNPDYIELAERRINGVLTSQPMLAAAE